MSLLKRVSDGLNRIMEYAMVTCGISMAVIVAAQVFSRYVLNHSLFWSEELARYLLIWLTFLGATVAYRNRVHPGIDLFVAGRSGQVRKIAAAVVHLASLSLFSVMIVSGVRFARFVQFQISPALGLPKWTVMVIIPVCGLVLTVHCLQFLVAELKGEGHDH